MTIKEEIQKINHDSIRIAGIARDLRNELESMIKHRDLCLFCIHVKDCVPCFRNKNFCYNFDEE